MSTQPELLALEAQVKEILNSNLGVFLGGIEGKDDAVRDIMGVLEERCAPAQCTRAPVAYASEEQLVEIVADPDDGSGVYIPLRKTPAGLFQTPLYAHPAAQCAPQPSGEWTILDVERALYVDRGRDIVLCDRDIVGVNGGTLLVKLREPFGLERTGLGDRPSSIPDPIRERDAIAEIIEPGIFAHDGTGSMVEFMGASRRTEALKKADAILALPAAGGEASKREAEIDRLREALEYAASDCYLDEVEGFQPTTVALKARAALAVVPDERNTTASGGAS
jgi:hypothetical protein